MTLPPEVQAEQDRMFRALSDVEKAAEKLKEQINEFHRDEYRTGLDRVGPPWDDMDDEDIYP
jgi:hypothetical protein